MVIEAVLARKDIRGSNFLSNLAGEAQRDQNI
jgi:hypothetical protein